MKALLEDRDPRFHVSSSKMKRLRDELKSLFLTLFMPHNLGCYRPDPSVDDLKEVLLWVLSPTQWERIHREVRSALPEPKPALFQQLEHLADEAGITEYVQGRRVSPDELIEQLQAEVAALKKEVAGLTPKETE